MAEGRASDSRLREPGFEFCAAVLKPWASFYLAIDNGGYVYEQTSCIIVAYGWMLPREAEMVSE